MNPFEPDPITRVPQNPEHIEAQQDAINQRRAERKAAMEPEQRVRLDIIEEVSAKLDKAQIPFALWAESAGGWFQFNRYDWDPDFDEMHRKTMDLQWSMLVTCLSHFSRTINGDILLRSPDGAVAVKFKGGQHEFNPSV